MPDLLTLSQIYAILFTGNITEDDPRRKKQITIWGNNIDFMAPNLLQEA